MIGPVSQKPVSQILRMSEPGTMPGLAASALGGTLASSCAFSSSGVVGEPHRVIGAAEHAAAVKLVRCPCG